MAPSRRAIRLLLLLLLALALPFAAGCSEHVDNSRVKLAPPADNTTLGPGDVFSLEIIGERGLPTEYQINSKGSVDLPYLRRIDVNGLEPDALADRIHDGLIEAKVLKDPTVIVRVRTYSSKIITLLGQFARQGSYPYASARTLVQAVSLAGGVTAIANTSQVTITRKTGVDKTQFVVVSFDAIMQGESPDIPLQAGDRIFIDQRVF